MKLFALLLLIGNLVFAGFLYVSETRGSSIVANTDFNAEKMRIVPFKVDPNADKGAAEPLACLEWSGIGSADLERAKSLIAELASADKVTETHVEEPTRYWVSIPPAANPAAMMAKLRAAGINDISLQPDNAISLGLFSNEETARRHLTGIQSKGFAEARVEPRSPHIKEATFVIRGLAKKTVDQFGKVAEKIEDSSVRSIDCVATEEKKVEGGV